MNKFLIIVVAIFLFGCTSTQKKVFFIKKVDGLYTAFISPSFGEMMENANKSNSPQYLRLVKQLEKAYNFMKADSIVDICTIDSIVAAEINHLDSINIRKNRRFTIMPSTPMSFEHFKFSSAHIILSQIIDTVLFKFEIDDNRLIMVEKNIFGRWPEAITVSSLIEQLYDGKKDLKPIQYDDNISAIYYGICRLYNFALQNNYSIKCTSLPMLKIITFLDNKIKRKNRTFVDFNLVKDWNVIK